MFWNRKNDKGAGTKKCFMTGHLDWSLEITVVRMARTNGFRGDRYFAACERLHLTALGETKDLAFANLREKVQHKLGQTFDEIFGAPV